MRNRQCHSKGNMTSALTRTAIRAVIRVFRCNDIRQVRRDSSAVGTFVPWLAPSALLSRRTCLTRIQFANAQF